MIEINHFLTFSLGVADVRFFLEDDEVIIAMPKWNGVFAGEKLEEVTRFSVTITVREAAKETGFGIFYNSPYGGMSERRAAKRYRERILAVADEISEAEGKKRVWRGRTFGQLLARIDEIEASWEDEDE